jgi:hypothetical protein
MIPHILSTRFHESADIRFLIALPKRSDCVSGEFVKRGRAPQERPLDLQATRALQNKPCFSSASSDGHSECNMDQRVDCRDLWYKRAAGPYHARLAGHHGRESAAQAVPNSFSQISSVPHGLRGAISSIGDEGACAHVRRAHARWPEVPLRPLTTVGLASSSPTACSGLAQCHRERMTYCASGKELGKTLRATVWSSP